ncbi:uncharacterized protein LOC112603173 [Melanaphis sacchari]|uniref:uncharacterized protein LOC112603173 n=1 Tax=Melanaphis sacchari TaxID=742174 RepID=UPI000DC13F75|nr:uncharacterized protein LOC112603173 [Melanaphis sacchari]
MSATKSYIRGIGLMIFIVVLLIVGGQSKDHRCRRPVTENCNASEEYIDGWKFTGWYYHTEMRACRPLFTPNGWHTCTENFELPEAREMCEDLCAEKCVMSNGAQGVCMYKEICKMYNVEPYAHKPCASESLTCCARLPDKGLLPYIGPMNEKAGVVQVGFRKKLSEPGYPRNKNGFVYFLPYHITNEGKRY